MGGVLYANVCATCSTSLLLLKCYPLSPINLEIFNLYNWDILLSHLRALFKVTKNKKQRKEKKRGD